MSDDPGPPLAGDLIRRLNEAADFVRRRVAGQFEVDPDTGFDPELNRAVLMPAARALYRGWFRVRMRGLEHVPGRGAALVVANHSGVLPVDALMLQVGLLDEHPASRNLRLLSADLVYSVPLLGRLARASGHVPAHRREANHLLGAGELVGVFPEGFKGIGKPFSDRYQLQQFGRGGFVRTALRNEVPMIPCAIVGAEEIYPMVADWRELATTLKLPYFPITPLFPWFGPLGAIPLPSNWLIEFCDPVPTDGFTADQCDDDEVVAELAGKVKDTIAGKIGELLAERGPAFGDQLALNAPDQEAGDQAGGDRAAADRAGADRAGGDAAARDRDDG
ncbi:MAG: lysophospholipid acyltransferase family protein [Streptosporangiaceae bacterium]